MACHQGPADTSTRPVRSPASSQCWPAPVSSTSINSMNGRLSRRIPIPLSTPHMRPGPNRAIAIRRSVSSKNASMHPLGPRLATTCNNAIESLTREPDKPDPAPAKTTAPSSPNSAIRCPRCLSSRIDTRNRAFKAGSTIGSVAEQRADVRLLHCHGLLAIRGATGSALQAFVPESSGSHGLVAIRVDHKYVHACLHEHAWRKWGI